MQNIERDNSTTGRFLGWASSHFWKLAGSHGWSIRPCITRETRVSSLVVDSGPCYHPLHRWQENCWTKHKTNRRKFYICADGPHTRFAAARLFHRCTSGKGYYSFPEAEMASKYKEESSAELILKLTRPRRGMPPCDGLGPTMCL